MPRSQATRQHDLARSQRLFAWLPAGARCNVVYGNAWITLNGDLADHFVRSGESLSLGHAGTVLIEALTQTRIEIAGAARPFDAGGGLPARIGAAIASALRRIRSRLQFGMPHVGDPAV